MFQRDKPNSAAKYFVLATWDDMWKLYESLPQLERDFYMQRYGGPNYMFDREEQKPSFIYWDFDYWVLDEAGFENPKQLPLEDLWRDQDWKLKLRKEKCIEFQNAFIKLFKTKYNITVKREHFKLNDSSGIKQFKGSDFRKEKEIIQKRGGCTFVIQHDSALLLMKGDKIKIEGYNYITGNELELEKLKKTMTTLNEMDESHKDYKEITKNENEEEMLARLNVHITDTNVQKHSWQDAKYMAIQKEKKNIESQKSDLQKKDSKFYNELNQEYTVVSSTTVANTTTTTLLGQGITPGTYNVTYSHTQPQIVQVNSAGRRMRDTSFLLPVDILGEAKASTSAIPCNRKGQSVGYYVSMHGVIRHPDIIFENIQNIGKESNEGEAPWSFLEKHWNVEDMGDIATKYNYAARFGDMDATVYNSGKQAKRAVQHVYGKHLTFLFLLPFFSNSVSLSLSRISFYI